EAFGGFYAISERAEGEFIDQLDEAQLRRVLPALFAMWDAAQHVDLSSTVGYGLWHADGRSPYTSWREALLSVNTDVPSNRTYGWRQKLSTSTIGSRTFEIAYAELERYVDLCPNDRHLVHSDL